MHLTKPITTLILVTTMAFGTVQGQESDQPVEATPPASDAPRRQMSDEQRAAMRERYENMSDEEKQALRDKMQSRRAERRAKWDSMSDEQRQAAREKMRQHRDGQGRPRPGASGRPDKAPDKAPDGA